MKVDPPIDRRHDAVAVGVLAAGLGAALCAILLVVGTPKLGAEWIMGDERQHISLNPLVTGSDDAKPLLERIGGAFTTVTDLYQPLPIASYAVEYALAPMNPAFAVRRTDLILHILNALLVFAILAQLLSRFTEVTPPTALIFGCCGAALWALHPALVLTYAADMGRTHLLSAFFLLIALWIQLAEMRCDRVRAWIGLLIISCVILANLSKPAPGFALIFLALVALDRGWKQAVRLPRVYTVFVVSVGFALLALQSTEAAGFVTDTENALFGDALSRAGFGAWMYVRDVVAPWLVTFWHPPSPETNYENPRVWVGFAVILVPIVVLMILFQTRKKISVIAFGMIVFWCSFIPLLGIASSRNVAAQDRYLYLPLLGIVTAIVAIAAKHPQTIAARSFLAAAILFCAGFAWLQRELTPIARDTVDRAAHSLRFYPNDPRVAEYYAVARSAAKLDPQSVHEALQKAISLADQYPETFVNDVDRAAFYRRQSFQFSLLGDVEASRKYAEAAVALDANSPKSYFRLATALRQAGDLAGAIAAFGHLEAHLSDDEALNAVWLTNFGRVLLYDVENADAARLRFQRVLENSRAPAEARRLATIDLALCEVRAGDGARGREMLIAYLRQNPEDKDAWRAMGESHLRSNLWEDAKIAYARVLVNEPTNYLALRGFHTACIRNNEPALAFQAWDQALAAAPEDPRFAAFRVWSAVCADIPGVCEEMAGVPADAEIPALVRLARAVCLASHQTEEAIAEVGRAAAGIPLPEESVYSSFKRAEALLERRTRANAPSEERVIQIVLRIRMGDLDGARQLADSVPEALRSRWDFAIESEFAQARAMNDK